MSSWGLESSRSVHGDERGMLRIRNPMVTIFHVWSGSYGESQRTRGSTKGKHGENERESLNRQVIDHTRARSPNTKVAQDSKSTKEDTRVTVLLREEVLIVFSGWRP